MKKLILISLILICFLKLQATTFYASPTGVDGNSGLTGQPVRTISALVALCTAPGDIGICEDGSYFTTPGGLFATITASGNAGAYITIKARNIGMAIIDGQSKSALRGFNLNGNYINIEGFEMKDTQERFFVINGTHLNIRDCKFHDNCGICSNTTDSYSAMSITNTASNVLIERCMFYNIGRLGTGESGCNPTPAYNEHDHGVYCSGATNLTVQNCIFYHIHTGFALQIYSGSDYTSSNVAFINNSCADGNQYHPAGHIIFWGSVNGALIANNIFEGHTQFAMQVYQGTYTYTNVAITKNISFGGNSTFSTGTATGVTFSSNTIADPLWTNKVGRDYTLTSGSPARDQGYNTGLATDYLKNARTNIDIGAFEYIPPAAGPGCPIVRNGNPILRNGNIIKR